VEIDGCPESPLIAKSPAAHLEKLDTAVGTLSQPIGGLDDNGIQNPPQVRLDHAGNLLHRLQPAADGTVVPALPALLGPGSMHVMPKTHALLLDGPGPGRFEISGPQRGKVAPLFAAHVGGIGLPGVLAALEEGIAFAKQRLVLLAADLVHRLAQCLGNMKLVEGNLLHGIRDGGQGGLDVGRPHIHGNALNRTLLGFIQPCIERLQRLLLAIFTHVDDLARLAVGYHRDVVVTLAESRFVHTQVGMPLVCLSPVQSPSYSPLHDSVDGVPAQSQLSAHGAGRSLLQPVNDQGLEQGCVTAARLGPGHRDETDAMLGAVDAGNLRAQNGPVLTGIQMAPLPRAFVVAGRRLATMGARQLGAGLQVHMDHHFPFLRVQLNVPYLSGAFNPQYLGVKVSISHGSTPELPTRVGEDPILVLLIQYIVFNIFHEMTDSMMYPKKTPIPNVGTKRNSLISDSISSLLRNISVTMYFGKKDNAIT